MGPQSAPEPPAPEFQAPMPASQEAKPLPEKAGFFWKMRNILVHPGRFFELAKRERDIGNGLSFFGILSFIHLALVIGFYLLREFMNTDMMDSAAVQALYALIPSLAFEGALSLFFGYIIVISLPFMASALIHAFVYLMGGRKGFHSTFKSVSYSLAPTILAWPVVVASYFFQSYAVLGYDVLSMLYSALLWVLIIWILYLLMRGIKRFHEISSARAFLAVALPIAIAVIVIIFLLLAAIITLISFFGSLDAGTQAGGLSIIDYSYKYDGSFSVAIRDMAEPVTIGTVSASCGEGEAYIDLDTTGYTHLEPGDSIQYSTGSNRCLDKDPGESYSVVVTVRYIDAQNSPNSFYRTLEGNALG
jgi:hypothetical protein